jgi:glycosyltransferase involved in cell wall biosynthesis
VRVLHVPHAYYPVIGGAEQICQRVSESLAQSGHQVKVLTTNVGAVQGYYELGVPSVQELNSAVAGVTIQRVEFCNGLYKLGGLISGLLGQQNIASSLSGRILQQRGRWLQRCMAREIEAFHPDVVMTMPHLVVNVGAVLSARRQVCFPLVMVPMLHEHDPNWNYESMKRALVLADAVIAMTSFEVERLTSAYEVPRPNVFLASVGVDIHLGAKDSMPRRPRIAFVGRKARSKGLIELIDAMCHVWKSRPDAELVLAGIRLPETAEIDAKIDSLPPSFRQKVTDVGQINNDEKSKLLQSSCCLVLPSRSESFGMVILEAWAVGTPAIVWDLPVFRGIVTQEENGLLADPYGGPTALASRILQLLNDPETAARMGESGRRDAKKYSWDEVASTYLLAYKHAIEHSNQLDAETQARTVR